MQYPKENDISEYYYIHILLLESILSIVFIIFRVVQPRLPEERKNHQHLIPNKKQKISIVYLIYFLIWV